VAAGSGSFGLVVVAVGLQRCREKRRHANVCQALVGEESSGGGQRWQ
jgi:hypothetical protein